MTEFELKEYLVKNYPQETEDCEWKEYSNLKHVVKGHEGDDIVSYVSAISNMNGGCLQKQSKSPKGNQGNRLLQI